MKRDYKSFLREIQVKLYQIAGEKHGTIKRFFLKEKPSLSPLGKKYFEQTLSSQNKVLDFQALFLVADFLDVDLTIEVVK